MYRKRGSWINWRWRKRDRIQGGKELRSRVKSGNERRNRGSQISRDCWKVQTRKLKRGKRSVLRLFCSLIAKELKLILILFRRRTLIRESRRNRHYLSRLLLHSSLSPSYRYLLPMHLAVCFAPRVLLRNLANLAKSNALVRFDNLVAILAYEHCCRRKLLALV